MKFQPMLPLKARFSSLAREQLGSVSFSTIHVTSRDHVDVPGLGSCLAVDIQGLSRTVLAPHWLEDYGKLTPSLTTVEGITCTLPRHPSVAGPGCQGGTDDMALRA